MFQTKEISPKSSKKCSVLSCNNTSRKNLDLSFHKFPAPNCRFVFIPDYFENKRKVDLLTAWKVALKVKEVTSSMRVCSMHFSRDDYVFPDLPTSKRKLRNAAVPNRFLPYCDKKKMEKNKERLERIKRREKSAHVNLKENDALSLKFESLDVSKTVNYDFYNDKMEDSAPNLKHECFCKLIEDVGSSADIPAQCLSSEDSNAAIIYEKSADTNVNKKSNVDTVYAVNTESDFFEDATVAIVCEETAETNINKKSNDTKYSENDKSNLTEDCSLTDELVSDAYKLQDSVKNGINVSSMKLSSKDIGVQVDTRYKFYSHIRTVQQLSTATGIESFEILNVIVESVKIATDNKYESEKFTMKTQDQVVMTYVKLKQSLSYSFLALVFDCVTPQHCRTIFLETVRVLSKCLKLAIPWPPKEEISKNIPQCFRNFEDTRVVLDCTEVFIQRPKHLCCQILTYSHYKGAQTAKLMTGVTPGGNISYISKPYGGRSSDTAIFEQSKLIQLLEPKDAVMADKGFLIEAVCQKNQLKFIQPPFLKNKKRFSMAEAELTAKVAKARVHVERSNQRIKVFKILGSVMPVALVPYLEDIFTTICGTVNLSAPIIGDDKFIIDEMDVT